MNRLSFAASAAILAALPFVGSAEKASAGTGAPIVSVSSHTTPLLQQVGYGVWREGWREWHGGWHPGWGWPPGWGWRSGCCWEGAAPPPPHVEYYPAPTYYGSGAYYEPPVYEPPVYERRTYERRTYESGGAPYVEGAVPPVK